MMMNSLHVPAKSLVKFSEVPKLQPVEPRTATVSPTEAETSAWKTETSLFERLSQASDKIRKWKTQMELDSKLKDRKLGEAVQTVEKLRTTVFELQAENETLGRKLHEELGNRDDVAQRLVTTRELCSGLKNFASHVEMHLNQCETEKVQLSAAVHDNIQQFKELSEQFSRLSLKANDSHAELAQKLAVEQAGGAEQEREFTCLIFQLQAELSQRKEECANMEQRLVALQMECEIKEKEILSLQGEYMEKNEEFLKLSKAFNEKESCIASLNSRLFESQKQTESCMKENEELKNAVELMRVEMDDKEKALKSLEKDCSEKKALITDLQTTIEELQLRLQILQRKFDDTVEVITKELADTKVQGEQQLTTLKEANDEEMTKIVNKTRMDLEKKSHEVHMFKQEFEALSEQHRLLEVKLDCREDEYSRTVAQLQELIDVCIEIDAFCVEETNRISVLMTNSLKELMGPTLTNENMEVQDQQSMTDHEQFRDRLDQLENQMAALLTSTMSSSLEDQAKDYKALSTKQEIQKLSSVHRELSGVLLEELKNVKKKLVDEQQKRKDLQKEYSKQLLNSEAEVEQLLSKKGSSDEAVVHYRELFTQAEEKLGICEKELENLVTENRTLRTKLEEGHEETASLMTNVEKLQMELKQVKALAEETTKKLTSQLEKEVQEKNHLQCSFSCRLADAQKEVEDLKKFGEQLRAGKEAAENQITSLAAQLSNSLTSYKKGCDDIVARKEREIDEEKRKAAMEIESLSRKLTDLQTELKACKMENEALTLEARTACNVAAAAAAATSKGKDEKDGARTKDKHLQANDYKPHSVATPLHLNRKEPTAKPTPRPALKPTSVIASVTPTVNKKLITPYKDKKMKLFQDENELPSADAYTSELFTPQHGILRRSNSVARKRTVMFAASQQSDDSSSCELVFIPPQVKSPCYRNDGNNKKIIEKSSSKPVYKIAPVKDSKLQKKSKTKGQKPMESIAWFDSDSVFGFGPED